MNHQIVYWRDEISRLWHRNIPAWLDDRISLFQTEERFDGFCAAKDLLQDSSESLLVHRRKGFSTNPYEAYLEFWGVLQAVIIQQDSIRELQYSLTGSRELIPKPEKGSPWMQIRDFRNHASGHPAAKGLNARELTAPAPFRMTTARTTKSYKNITVGVFEGQGPKFKKIGLGEMIDRYDEQGAGYVSEIFKSLEDFLTTKL